MNSRLSGSYAAVVESVNSLEPSVDPAEFIHEIDTGLSKVFGDELTWKGSESAASSSRFRGGAGSPAECAYNSTRRPAECS